MPVVAQGCRSRAVPTVTVTDAVMQPRFNLAHVYADDELDTNTLKGAIAAAQQARTLQTGNAAAFLAATGGSGRHPYAGKNVRIKSSTTDMTGISGYVTEKGLFKQWSDANLMTKSGKYGCPAATTITDLTGAGNNYSVPDLNDVKGSYAGTGTDRKVNYGLYVGAPITNSNPRMFMGSKFAQTAWDGNDASLPACGNEGSNVQVVYPAKSTGASYRGTYNAVKSGGEPYMTKQDMGTEIVNYESCKQRAEDVGHSVFGLSSDKCYTAPTLNESTQGGIAYEVYKTKVVYPGPTPAKQLHFSMNGLLSLLSSDGDNSKSTNTGFHPNSLYEFGRNTLSQSSDNIPNKCMYGYGGLLSESPKGTYGDNCNSVRIPYLKSVYIGTW